MMLTTKGRYAVTAMLDIVYFSSENKPIALHDISLRQHIPLSYLEQLFNKLKKHSLVLSFKGPGGGYVLKKTPKEINIYEIITAVDESVKMTSCIAGENLNCKKNGSEPCITHALWNSLGNHIATYLQETTLEDIRQIIK